MNRNVIGHEPVIDDGDPATERVRLDVINGAHGCGGGPRDPAEHRERRHGHREHPGHPGCAHNEEAEDDHQLFRRFLGHGRLARGDTGFAARDRLQSNG